MSKSIVAVTMTNNNINNNMNTSSISIQDMGSRWTASLNIVNSLMEVFRRHPQFRRDTFRKRKSSD